MLYLAIDQHSKQLTMNVREESGRIVQRKQVGTRGDAVSEFLTQLAERSGADGYAAIVEVGGFNDWLLDLLPERGCRHVVLVQPRQSSPRKTDRRDANPLRELLWVNRHRLLAGQRVQGLRRVDEQQRVLDVAIVKRVSESADAKLLLTLPAPDSSRESPAVAAIPACHVRWPLPQAPQRDSRRTARRFAV